MVNNTQQAEADYPYTDLSYNKGINGTCTADLSKGVVRTSAA